MEKSQRSYEKFALEVKKELDSLVARGHITEEDRVRVLKCYSYMPSDFFEQQQTQTKEETEASSSG